MEGAIGDSEKGARLRVVGVLAIALEKGQRRHKVPLLQEVIRVWQTKLLLLGTVKQTRSASLVSNGQE